MRMCTDLYVPSWPPWGFYHEIIWWRQICRSLWLWSLFHTRGQRGKYWKYRFYPCQIISASWNSYCLFFILGFNCKINGIYKESTSLTDRRKYYTQARTQFQRRLIHQKTLILLTIANAAITYCRFELIDYLTYLLLFLQRLSKIKIKTISGTNFWPDNGIAHAVEVLGKVNKRIL